MTIVMGLDQHRAQITAEWIDTATGEVSLARVSPADRAGVRRFLGRFAGQELEVALEATTGWRFVVEELRAVGARAHLAEPAETSALRGNKMHAKSDRADARHLRELLMTGRLPECWIAPDHLLDLRAKVRLRHSLVNERGEWQQRIRAVLCHHGFPRRSDLDLLTATGRDWLAGLPLPTAACEQVRVGLEMIAALDTQIPTIGTQLRAYARAQPGCRALMGHYGIGERPRSRSSPSSVTAGGSPPPATRCATPAWTSPCTPPTVAAHPDTSPVRDPRFCAGRSTRRRRPRRAPVPLTTPTTDKPRSDSGTTARASRSRATSSNAATTPSRTSATRHSRQRENTSRARHAPRQPMHRGRLPTPCCPPRPRGRPPKTERPHRTFPQREPHHHHVADQTANSRVEDRDKHGHPRAPGHLAELKEQEPGLDGNPTTQISRCAAVRGTGPPVRQTRASGASWRLANRKFSGF